jgi:hypothetical protein
MDPENRLPMEPSPSPSDLRLPHAVRLLGIATFLSCTQRFAFTASTHRNGAVWLQAVLADWVRMG